MPRCMLLLDRLGGGADILSQGTARVADAPASRHSARRLMKIAHSGSTSVAVWVQHFRAQWTCDGRSVTTPHQIVNLLLECLHTAF